MKCKDCGSKNIVCDDEDIEIIKKIMGKNADEFIKETKKIIDNFSNKKKPYIDF